MTIQRDETQKSSIFTFKKHLILALQGLYLHETNDENWSKGQFQVTLNLFRAPRYFGAPSDAIKTVFAVSKSKFLS